MNEYIFFLPFIAFIVLFLFIVFLGIRLRNKRKRELKELALNNGFLYDENADFLKQLNFISLENLKTISIDHINLGTEKKSGFFKFFPEYCDLEYTGLKIFTYGHSPRAENLILVPFKSNRILFFDYSYTTDGGKNSSTHSFTVALLKSKDQFPNFYLRPENIIDKIVAFIGFDDIDISNYPEFSKKYYLKGDEQNSVMSFFTPERIMAFEQNQGWTIYSSRNYFLLYKKNTHIPVKDYLTYIEEVKNLLNSLRIE